MSNANSAYLDFSVNSVTLLPNNPHASLVYTVASSSLGYTDTSLTVTLANALPEPASLALLATAIGGAWVARRRRVG